MIRFLLADREVVVAPFPVVFVLYLAVEIIGQQQHVPVQQSRLVDEALSSRVGSVVISFLVSGARMRRQRVRMSRPR